MTTLTGQLEGTLLVQELKSAVALLHEKLHGFVDLVAVVTETVLLKLVVVQVAAFALSLA